MSGEAVCSEGSPGGGRSLAANNWGTARTARHKPDQWHPLNIQAPPPKMKTAMTWTSQRPGRADPVRRSTKRSIHGSLIGLVSGA